MIKVYIKKQSNYPINTPNIKRELQKFFKKKGIVSDSDVSLTFVGEKKMIELGNKFLKEKDRVHNVLSFPFTENSKKFIEPPDNIIHLGDIVVCYPKVIEEAKREGKLIDTKVYELVEHGALHLLGEHHE